MHHREKAIYIFKDEISPPHAFKELSILDLTNVKVFFIALGFIPITVILGPHAEFAFKTITHFGVNSSIVTI